MQQPEPGAGLQAQFPGHDAPRVLVGGQRVGLPAAAVQAQHQLRVELLLQRVGGDQLAQFRHDLAMPPQVQIGVDPRGEGLPPLVFEGGNLAVAQQRRRHVSQRIAAPQPERLAEQAGRPHPVSGLGGGMAARGQHAELADIQLVVGDADQVTGRPGLDQLRPGRAQRRAQALDGAVQGTPCPGRRLAFPEHARQGVQADHSPGAQQQPRQQHPLPGRGNRYLPRAVPDDQRPEQPEVHARPLPGHLRCRSRRRDVVSADTTAAYPRRESPVSGGCPIVSVS